MTSASDAPQNLAIVNVEAVNTRWVTDLEAFLEAVDRRQGVRTPGVGKTSPTSMKEDEREMDEAKGRLQAEEDRGRRLGGRDPRLHRSQGGPRVHQGRAVAEPPEHGQVRGGQGREEDRQVHRGRARPGQGEGVARLHLQVLAGQRRLGQQFVNINASPLDGILGGGSGGDSRRSGGPSMAGPMAPPSDLEGRRQSRDARRIARAGLERVDERRVGGGTLPGSGAMSPVAVAPPTTGGAQTTQHWRQGRSPALRVRRHAHLARTGPEDRAQPRCRLARGRADVTRSLTDAPTEPAERGRAVGIESTRDTDSRHTQAGMPNMKNNDALKKHHFWILFGLVPLFVLIAVLMISSNVGGEVKKQRRRDRGRQEGPRRARPTRSRRALLAEWDKAIATVDGKSGGLWKDNWDKQKDLFTWPKSDAFTGFATTTKVDGKDVVKEIRIEDLSFGQPIPNNLDQYAEFKKPEFYLAEYSTKGLTKIAPGQLGMADRIAPTQFKGGWQSHLRHVERLGRDRPSPRTRSGS